MESEIYIDLKDNTATIEYINLIGPEREIESIRADLETLEGADVSEYCGCELTALNVRKEANELDIHLELNIIDKNAFLEYISILKGPDGNLYLAMYEMEKVSQSNGKKVLQDGMHMIQFQPDQNIALSIHLKTGEDLKKHLTEYYGKMISLADFWK